MNVTDSGLDLVRKLLLMAGKDLKAMKSLLHPDSADDEIFGFHAQQTVEKSLKAWIAATGGEYGRMHDLSRLFIILENLGCDANRFEDLEELNPFAVGLRYEAMEPEEPKLDRPNLLSRVKALHDHVQKVLEKIERSQH